MFSTGAPKGHKTPGCSVSLFHNLSNYDSHLFVKKLKGKIKCIPNNEEQSVSKQLTIFYTLAYVYKCKTTTEGKTVEVKRELRFIDSYRFTPTRLNALTENLDLIAS